MGVEGCFLLSSLQSKVQENHCTILQSSLWLFSRVAMPYFWTRSLSWSKRVVVPEQGTLKVVLRFHFEGEHGTSCDVSK